MKKNTYCFATKNLTEYIAKVGKESPKWQYKFDKVLTIGDTEWMVAVIDNIMHFIHETEPYHLEIGIGDNDVVEFRDYGISSYAHKLILPSMFKFRPYWVLGFKKTEMEEWFDQYEKVVKTHRENLLADENLVEFKAKNQSAAVCFKINKDGRYKRIVCYAGRHAYVDDTLEVYEQVKVAATLQNIVEEVKSKTYNYENLMH